MIESSGFPMVAVIAGLIIFMFVWPLTFKNKSEGFILILGGAILNLIDRIPDGKVSDYINIGIATLNFADIAIYTGIIYAAKSLFSRGHRPLG